MKRQWEAENEVINKKQKTCNLVRHYQLANIIFNRLTFYQNYLQNFSQTFVS